MKLKRQTSTTATPTYPATLEYGDLAVANNGVPAFGDKDNLSVPLGTAAEIKQINSSLSVAAAGFSLNAPADTSFSYVRASFIKLNKDQIFIAGSIKINNSVSSNGWITTTDGNWGGLLSENAECYLSGTTAALTFYSNGVNILFNARSSTVPAGIYTFFKLTNADSAVSI